jgi:LysM repeat protein
MTSPSGEKNARLIIEGDISNAVPCMFNPTELSLSHSNDWSDKADGQTTGETVAGRGIQQLNFRGSKNGSLDLTLFFDTTSTGTAVTTYTEKIVKLMDIDSTIQGTDTEKGIGRPPTVEFEWGEDFKSFPAVIERLTLKYTYFSSTGTPLRATMSLSLKQYKDPNSLPAQNPTSGTPLPHRVHRVQPGETLDRISAQHYGDATKWRLLAAANGIEDPLALHPGGLLAVPKVDA